MMLGKKNTTPQQHTTNASILWKEEYYDGNIFQPIIKVDSHQLDKNGTQLASPRRYPTPMPNICTLSDNHFVDIYADINFSTFYPAHCKPLKHSRQPTSTLRFFFHWTGHMHDKSTSPFLRHCFQNEIIKRLKNKPTQGLLWRAT